MYYQDFHVQVHYIHYMNPFNVNELSYIFNNRSVTKDIKKYFMLVIVWKNSKYLVITNMHSVSCLETYLGFFYTEI